MNVKGKGDPKLAAPSGYNVCLRVGGMDVIIIIPGAVKRFLAWLVENPCF
jgi:hypothetical protein